MASGESKTSARRVSAKIRRSRALALRAAGATYDQIAQAPISDTDRRPLYRDRRRAHEAVDVALQELRRESNGRAAQVAELEKLRLDQMHMAIWPMTQPRHPVTCPECEHVLWREPDLAAVTTVVKLQERRTKYEGADAEDLAGGGELLQEQVELAQRAFLSAMTRAGISPAQQREVMQHAAEILREAEDETG